MASVSLRDVLRAWRLFAGWAGTAALGYVMAARIDLRRDAEDSFPLASFLLPFMIRTLLILPVGVVVGVVWQIASRRRRGQTPVVAVLILVGVASLAFFAHLGVGARWAWESNQGEDERSARNMAALQTMPEDALRGIDVYDRWGTELLLRIRDQEALSQFIRACRDLRPYSGRNRADHRRTYYLVLRVSRPEHLPFPGLQCCYQRDDPSAIVARLARRLDEPIQGMRYYGTVSSPEFKAWLDEYVADAIEDPQR
jgi:flagellin-like protein